jgi:hypothetical protein
MTENFTKQINAFLSTLRTTYSQQGQTGKIFLVLAFLLVSCCLCAIPISVFSRRAPSTAVPSPNIFPTTGIGTEATPTPLFNFDFPTFTPFPTLPFATALPTLTPLPTITPLPTGTETRTQVPQPTSTPLPTATATRIPPTATATSIPSVTIIHVDKAEEYVEIQNQTNAAVNLRGWRLVSEAGDQSCALRGTLEPNEILRIWGRRGQPGFDCRLGSNIWDDNSPDPAVLYNAQGEEVSRFP